MARPDVYDPFAFLIQEIRERDDGVRPWDPGLRSDLLGALLINEAEECAWGRRHVSVVHGDVTDPVDADRLDGLFAELEELLDPCRWARFSGSRSWYFTLTVGGGDADMWAEVATALCARWNPGGWRILATACVISESTGTQVGR